MDLASLSSKEQEKSAFEQAITCQPSIIFQKRQKDGCEVIAMASECIWKKMNGNGIHKLIEKSFNTDGYSIENLELICNNLSKYLVKVLIVFYQLFLIILNL